MRITQKASSLLHIYAYCSISVIATQTRITNNTVVRFHCSYCKWNITFSS